MNATAARSGVSRARADLGIVVPALDEASRIDATLAGLAPCVEAGADLVVVDGGSRDDTRARVEASGLRCISAPRGRALQMNAGAAACRGRLLAFVHADTRVSAPAAARLLALAAEGRSCWGRFDVRMDAADALLAVVAAAMNLRSRLTAIATGDQVLFVTRDLFAQVGGFPPIPLMEDVAISAALRRICRPCCRRETVTTSARRWQRHGRLRTIALMWSLRLRYALGADPDVLARAYRAHGDRERAS